MKSNGRPEPRRAFRDVGTRGRGYASFRFQGKPVWVFDGFDAQVNVEIRPVEMSGGGLLDVQDLPDRNIFEPGEILV